MYYYAVHKGVAPGIYDNWCDCQKQVIGFKDAKFKKCKSSADAEFFYKHGMDKPSSTTATTIHTPLFRTQMKLDKFIVYADDIFEETNTSNNRMNTKEDHIIVYTDGGCVNNGKKNAKAGYGIYFGPNDVRNVSKRIIGKQTNNVAEITAIIEAILLLKPDIDKNITVHLFTDSEYSIKCCYKYGEKLEKNNWTSKYPIPNIHLVKKAYYLCKLHKNVKIHFVKAHTGNQDRNSIGNFHADRLANEAIN